MSTYGYPTTMRFSRTMRQSGTELANAIEHHKRTDTSGIVIAVVVLAPIIAALAGHWIGRWIGVLQ